MSPVEDMIIQICHQLKLDPALSVGSHKLTICVQWLIWGCDKNNDIICVRSHTNNMCTFNKLKNLYNNQVVTKIFKVSKSTKF